MPGGRSPRGESITPFKLQRSAVSLLLLLLALGAAHAAPTISGVVYADLNHDGVCTPGEALPGVLVSDGAVVRPTDEQGRYTLPLSDEGALVRLSIPTGYWPEKNRWFERVPAADTAVCDFPLQPHAEAQYFRVVQVTDIHYLKAANRHLRAFCAQINALQPQPAFVMSTGDLVVDANGLTKEDAASRLFAAYREAMAPLKSPVFNLPGNHDLPAACTKLAPT